MVCALNEKQMKRLAKKEKAIERAWGLEGAQRAKYVD